MKIVQADTMRTIASNVQTVDKILKLYQFYKNMF